MSPVGSVWHCLIAVLVAIAWPAAAQSQGGHDFKVFDGTLYRDKPDMRRYGLTPIDILYAARFWTDAHSLAAMDALPDEGTVRSVAREAAAAGAPVVVDIEHWRLSGDDALMRANLAKYITVLQWLRDEAPGLNLGYFGRLPMAAYAWALGSPYGGDYRRWQVENTRRAPLAVFVDAVYPPLYTYSDQRRAWVRYATANLREARRYGRPVYAFLWPQYSEKSGKLALQFLPPDFWRLQLETVRAHADGVVIWGGWDDTRKGPADWDPAAPWWRVTREFLNDQGLAAR